MKPHSNFILPPPRKSLGQHFLHDPVVLQRIVSYAQLDRSTLAFEIGPGRGALTQKLLDAAGGVVAVEIDRTLATYLREHFAPTGLVVHEGDITRCDIGGLIQVGRETFGLPNGPVRVVANLPYNLSSPILEKLIEERHLFTDLTVMLQREVVERVSSPPGSKTYGYFSVFVQAFCLPQHLFDVSPQAFSPPPKVWSSVMKLTPRPTPLLPAEVEPTFLEVISAAFRERRKMLGKVLLSVAPRPVLLEAFAKVGISPQQRAETLSVEEFVQLATEIRQGLEQ
ncbi:MAG: 16S rRNA (adenine(1518)-N(6)/adenine(1519)-N(6))-dimethyltransferase RsmA [Blastocatellia bacterium]|nr:16S rRNA (adenine(1518)-N(6)/adenine(1519)-N(6))-dimethyltransferase RsmA [Blastocatellia bacterium]